MDKPKLTLVVNKPANATTPEDGSISPEELDELLAELGDYGTSIL